jgi:hypothetical protein
MYWIICSYFFSDITLIVLHLRGIETGTHQLSDSICDFFPSLLPTTLMFLCPDDPLIPSIPSTSAQATQALGFGDLCRYFYRALKENFEDYTAHNVS